MIHPSQFDRAIVNDFKTERNNIDLDKFVGFDSEAYINGEAFMFCTSMKDIILPENLLDTLFSETYIQSNFLLYNLKYDAGAMFRHLIPTLPLKELQMYHDVKYDGFYFKYIPHKFLRISRIGKMKTDYVQFWDIAQFFRLSLKKAAEKYLPPELQKFDEDTEEYTTDYVDIHWDNIADYCIQDATITLKLGEYFFSKLKDYSLPIKAIYSSASISAEWINQRIDVFTAHNWYFRKHRLIAYACEAYRGGKFEMTARGSANVYMYDIASAYPYEIRNLVDIRNAKTYTSNVYQERTLYGFLRVKIDNRQEKYLPSGIFEGKGLIYPAGIFHTTITKQEYDYMVFELDIPVEIIQGEWIELRSEPVYPFRKTFDELFKMKDSYKNVDAMMYAVSKIIMNGYYGKMVQVTDDRRKEKKKVGRDWNPIYGAIITANTRIEMCKVQNELKEKCLGVHTDSVITTIPLPEKFLKRKLKNSKLGSWECEVENEPAILIATGQYQIGKKLAYRGLVPRIIEENGEYRKDSWREILERFPGVSEIPYIEKKKPESWTATMARNRPVDEINMFECRPKTLDLNCDTKRDWPTKFKTDDFLSKLEQGPPITVGTLPIKFWKKYLPYYLPKTKQ